MFAWLFDLESEGLRSGAAVYCGAAEAGLVSLSVGWECGAASVSDWSGALQSEGVAVFGVLPAGRGALAVISTLIESYFYSLSSHRSNAWLSIISSLTSKILYVDIWLTKVLVNEWRQTETMCEQVAVIKVSPSHLPCDACTDHEWLTHHGLACCTLIGSWDK